MSFNSPLLLLLLSAKNNNEDSNQKILLSDCDKEEFDLHCFALWNSLDSLRKHYFKNLQVESTSAISHNNNSNAAKGGNKIDTIDHSSSSGPILSTTSSNISNASSGAIIAGVIATEINNFVSSSSSSSLQPSSATATSKTTPQIRSASVSQRQSVSAPLAAVPISSSNSRQLSHRNSAATAFPQLHHFQLQLHQNVKQVLHLLQASPQLLFFQQRGNGGILSSSNHQFNELFRQNNVPFSRKINMAKTANAKLYRHMNNNNNHNNNNAFLVEVKQEFQSTTLGAANRERDRAKLFKKHGILPESGSRIASMFASDGILIAQGYTRLVFTDEGVFFELTSSNVNWNIFRHHLLSGPSGFYHEHYYYYLNNNKERGTLLARLRNQFKDVKFQQNPPESSFSPSINGIDEEKNTSTFLLNTNNNKIVNNHRSEGYGDFIPGLLYLDSSFVDSVDVPSGSGPAVSFNSFATFKVLTPEGVLEEIFYKRTGEGGIGHNSKKNNRSNILDNFIVAAHQLPATQNKNILSRLDSGSNLLNASTVSLNNNNNDNNKLTKSFRGSIPNERVAAENSYETKADVSHLVDRALKYYSGIERNACSDLFFELVRGRFGGDGDGVGIQRLGSLFRFCQHDPETVKRLFVYLRILDRCDEKLLPPVMSDLTAKYDDQQFRKNNHYGNNISATTTSSSTGIDPYNILRTTVISLSERRLEQIENSSPLFLSDRNQVNSFNSKMELTDWLFYRRAEIAAAVKYCQNSFSLRNNHNNNNKNSVAEKGVDPSSWNETKYSIVVHFQNDNLYLCRNVAALAKRNRKLTKKELEEEEASRIKMEEERMLLEKDPEEILKEIIERKKKQEQVTKNAKFARMDEDDDYLLDTQNQNNNNHSHSEGNSSSTSMVDRFRSKIHGSTNNNNNNQANFIKDLASGGVSAALAAAQQRKEEMMHQRQLMQIRRQKMILMSSQKLKSLAMLMEEESRKRPFKFHLTFGDHGMPASSSSSTSPQSNQQREKRFSVLEIPDPAMNFTSAIVVPDRILEGIFQIEWTSLESFLACIDRGYPIQETEEDRIMRLKREESENIRAFSSVPAVSTTMGRATATIKNNEIKSSASASSSSAKNLAFQFPGSLRWCARKWFWHKCPLVLIGEQYEKLNESNKNYHDQNRRNGGKTATTKNNNGNCDDDDSDGDDDENGQVSRRRQCYSRKTDDMFPGRFRCPTWWKLNFFENSAVCKDFREKLHGQIAGYVEKHKKKVQNVPSSLSLFKTEEQRRQEEEEAQAMFNPLLRRERMTTKSSTSTNQLRSSLLQPKENAEDLQPFAFLDQFFLDDVYSIGKNINVQDANRCLPHHHHQQQNLHTNANMRLGQACASSSVVHPKYFVKHLERQEELQREERESERQRKIEEEAAAAVAERARLIAEEERKERVKEKNRKRLEKLEQRKYEIHSKLDDDETQEEEEEEESDDDDDQVDHDEFDSNDHIFLSGDASGATTVAPGNSSTGGIIAEKQRRRSSAASDTIPPPQTRSGDNLPPSFLLHSQLVSQQLHGTTAATTAAPKKKKPSAPFFILTVEDESRNSTSSSASASSLVDNVIAFCKGSIETNISASPLHSVILPYLHSAASSATASWTILKIESLLVGENVIDQAQLMEVQQLEEKVRVLEAEVDSYGFPVHDTTEMRNKLKGLQKKPFASFDVAVFVVKALFETFKMESSENVILLVEVDEVGEEEEEEQETKNSESNNAVRAPKEKGGLLETTSEQVLLKEHFNLKALSHSRRFWREVLGCCSFFPKRYSTKQYNNHELHDHDEARQTKKKEILFHMFQ